MSKFELRERAYQNSGVTYEQSLMAIDLVPSVYEQIGKEEGFQKLSQLFYDRVFLDKDATWFLNIFSSSTKEEAVDNQYRFLVQTFGGPDLYRQKKGKYTRLVGRHANYNIGNNAAIRWVNHMVDAMECHDVLKTNDELKTLLRDYFNYTAHYIVVSMEFMRSDQVCANFISFLLFNQIIFYLKRISSLFGFCS